MIQEDKDLLLKDLCARLPYGIISKTPYNDAIIVGIINRKGVRKDIDYIDVVTDKQTYPIRYIKPYLRPMSSMTSQEWCELCDCDTEDEKAAIYIKDGRRFVSHVNKETFLNSHHFDYRGLIEKGLALEAPEGMYNN